MFKTILQIFLKEFNRIFTVEAIVSILVSGALLYFFYYPIPYDNEEVRNAPAVVVDLDNSTLSRDILRKLNATDRIEIVSHVHTMDEAEHMMRNREVYGIFYIAPGFEQNILSGRSGGFSFYGDASYVIIYSRMMTAVQSVVKTMSRSIGAAKQVQMGVDPAIAFGNSTPITPVVVPLYNPQNGYATYVIPPVYVLIVFQCLFLALVISLILGRNSDFDKGLIAPQKASPFVIAFMTLAGKWLAYFMVSIVIFICYMGITPIFYELPFHGSLPRLMLFGLLFLSATIFMSTFIGLFFRKFDSVFLIILPSSMLIFFLSGMSWPTEMIPWGLRIFTYLMPVFPAITSMITINQMGGGFSNIIPELMLLVIQLGVYGLLALFMMTRYYCRLQKGLIVEQSVTSPVTASPVASSQEEGAKAATDTAVSEATFGAEEAKGREK